MLPPRLISDTFTDFPIVTMSEPRLSHVSIGRGVLDLLDKRADFAACEARRFDRRHCRELGTHDFGSYPVESPDIDESADGTSEVELAVAGKLAMECVFPQVTTHGLVC